MFKDKKWSDRVLFLMCGITTCVLLISIFTHAIKASRSRGEMRQGGGEELLKKWGSQSFSSVESPSTIFIGVSNAVYMRLTNSAWSFEQKDKLEKSAQGMILAFSTGDYKDYQQFRFPIKDGRFNVERVKELYTGLKNYDPSFQTYAFDQTDINWAWKTFEKFWNFAGIVTNTYCSKCWKGVNVQSINVFPLVQVGSAPDLKDIILSDENVGANWWNPCFVFNPDMNQLLNADKHIDAAVISLLVLTETNNMAGGVAPVWAVTEQTKATPIYCLFYWVPEKRVWLPGAFGSAYSGAHKAIYLF